MNIDISPQLLTAAGFTEDELRQEFIIFYKCDNISLGKAAEFAQMHKIAFQRLLAERCIPLNYDYSRSGGRYKGT